MPSGIVFVTAAGRDTVGIVKRDERMKEFEGGRRPTTERSETEGEMHRQISFKCEPKRRTEPSIRSVGKDRMIVLFNWKLFKEIAILWRISSI